jgi:hypothetical protein
MQSRAVDSSAKRVPTDLTDKRMWTGRTFRLREKLRAITSTGTVEHITAGTVVVVASEKVMHVVTVQVQNRRLIVFADDLEKCGEEIKGPEDSGET